MSAVDVSGVNVLNPSDVVVPGVDVSGVSVLNPADVVVPGVDDSGVSVLAPADVSKVTVVGSDLTMPSPVVDRDARVVVSLLCHGIFRASRLNAWRLLLARFRRRWSGTTPSSSLPSIALGWHCTLRAGLPQASSKSFKTASCCLTVSSEQLCALEKDTYECVP